MHKFILIPLIIILVGCSSPIPKSETDWENILKLAENNKSEDQTRWISSSGEVIFNGSLVKGDCELFKRTAQDNKVLVVNSQGGFASEGLCIAQEMRNKGFKETIVDGVCFSSCANYLFLASEKKLIRKGIVGFHGNITALISGQSKLKKQYPNLVNDSTMEKSFFESLQVPQAFFDQTQKADKGEKNNKSYLFLIPSPETFQKINVKNVLGKQDLNLINEMNRRGFSMLYK